MKITPSLHHQRKSISKENDLVKADLQRALVYKEYHTINSTNSEGVVEPYPLDVNISEFTRFGVGLYLYFYFLKGIVLVFFIMSLFASVSCIMNSLGDGLSSWKNLNDLQKLSIGNQDQLIVTSNSTQNAVNIINFYNSQFTNHNIASWLDFTTIVIFILFIFIFEYTSNKIIKSNSQVSLQPNRFALQVLYINDDKIQKLDSQEHNPSDLKGFLERYAPVREVHFAKNYSNTLSLHQKEAKLNIQIITENLKQGTDQESKTNLNKLKEELDKVKDEVAQIVNTKIGPMTSHNQYPTLSAFVIFETVNGKQQFIQKYREITNLSFFSRCCLGKSIPKEDLFRGVYRLKIVEQVDNPSNIKWENLEVQTPERVIRLVAVFLAVFLLMIITFFIVFGANIVSNYDPSECPASKYTEAEADAQMAAATTASDKTFINNCFCMGMEIQTLYTNYFDRCNDIIYVYTGRQALQIASAFVIVFVNTLLKILIQSVSNFVRYTSVSKLLSGQMSKLFIVTFINTALITLILNADIYGFKLAIYLSSPIPPLQSAQYNQVYPNDLNRQWYATVGASLINTWIINMVSPYLIEFVIYPIVKFFRNRSVHDAVLQRDMNNLIVGPQFLLSIHYATALNTVFVTLFYSSSIPLMLPMATVALFIQFWVQKYMMIRFYKKPIAYDEVLHNTGIKILPFAVILHLALAIWTFGHPLIFPYDEKTLDVVTETSGQYIKILNDSVWQRISTTPQLSLLLLFFIIIMVLRAVLIDPLSYIFGLCCSGDTNIVDDATNNINYSEVYAQISHDQLATYDIMSNEDYIDLIRQMNDAKIIGLESQEERRPLKQ